MRQLLTVLKHIFMAITFRHDGKGLPEENTPALLVLISMACFSGNARIVFIGPGSIYSIVGFNTAFLMTCYFVGKSKGSQIVAVIMCVVFGIDLITIIGDFAGYQFPPVILTMWAIMAWSFAYSKIVARNKQGKADKADNIRRESHE